VSLQSASIREEVTAQYNKSTSQKNSFPRKPQNQEIHDTSSELLIVKTPQKSVHKIHKYVITYHTEDSTCVGLIKRLKVHMSKL